MDTRHRKDISFADLSLLAQVVCALNRVRIKSVSPVYELGETDMLLPRWVEGDNGWELSRYKVVRQEALGITCNGLRKACKGYMKVEMKSVLDLLYRLSVIAVTPDARVGEEPHFRQSFSGSSKTNAAIFGAGYMTEFVKAGFIIEKRRAIGGFI